MSSSNAPTSADFDCEFNAPQFFDFAKMNAGGADDNETFDEDIGEAEKYFGKNMMLKLLNDTLIADMEGRTPFWKWKIDTYPPFHILHEGAILSWLMTWELVVSKTNI